jgi:hypothetical protein
MALELRKRDMPLTKRRHFSRLGTLRGRLPRVGGQHVPLPHCRLLFLQNALHPFNSILELLLIEARDRYQAMLRIAR